MKEPGSNVRDRLLNAAEQVVARDGVRNCTLEAVAKEAEVSKGGLLYHFATKSALLTAIVERLAARFDNDQRQSMEQDRETYGAFTRAYLLARMEKPGPEEKPLHTALLAAAGTDPQYLDPFRKRIVEWQALLDQDGIDPAIATIVRLAIDGLCLNSLLGIPVPEGEERQRIIDKLLAMTLENQSERGTTQSDPAGE